MAPWEPWAWSSQAVGHYPLSVAGPGCRASVTGPFEARSSRPQIEGIWTGDTMKPLWGILERLLVVVVEAVVKEVL